MIKSQVRIPFDNTIFDDCSRCPEHMTALYHLLTT
ncbi:MAG: hypothetical protein QOC99_1094 [Acidobacteriota bacterium]|nr:hypothetical protein [Acidobacteriota bacterium]